MRATDHVRCGDERLRQELQDVPCASEQPRPDATCIVPIPRRWYQCPRGHLTEEAQEEEFQQAMKDMMSIRTAKV